MSTFEVRVRLLSTVRLTSNGDRRTGRGFMKVEKKDLKIWLVVIFEISCVLCHLGVVKYLKRGTR